MALRHYPKEIEELMEIWEPYEDKVKDMIYHRQLNLFTNHQNINQKDEKEALEKEKNLQKATLKIKQKYGKNAILKGMNFYQIGRAHV